MGKINFHNSNLRKRFWFITFTLFFGLVIPVVNSASDFLKMKGKPANFDNLKMNRTKIVQFANESTQRVGQLYQENKHYVADAGNGFATFLRVVFGGIFAFFALVLFIGTLHFLDCLETLLSQETSMFNFFLMKAE